MSTKPARKASNPHVGSDFDDFLREEGLYDKAQAIAVKRVLAYELERGMVKAQLTKTAMAKRTGTTRAQLDRLLTPTTRRRPCRRWCTQRVRWANG
jgi:antitoxin HicB